MKELFIIKLCERVLEFSIVKNLEKWQITKGNLYRNSNGLRTFWNNVHGKYIGNWAFFSTRGKKSATWSTSALLELCSVLSRAWITNLRCITSSKVTLSSLATLVKETPAHYHGELSMRVFLRLEGTSIVSDGWWIFGVIRRGTSI